MYKRILVPVDGSDTSNFALKQAIGLAKEQNAEIRLIHVVEEMPPYVAMESPYPLHDYRRMNHAAGEAVLAKCAVAIKDAGVPFGSKLASAESLSVRTCDLIDEEARQWPADLIVIGTHGRRGFNRLLLGSVAEGVIRTTSKPILIVRGQ